MSLLALSIGKVVLYAAVGTELTTYHADTTAGTLTRRTSVSCPANIQYVWPHPSRKFLYAAWSNGGPVGVSGRPSGGSSHGVTAYRVDPASGALSPHGAPAPLVSRPVHIAVDRTGTHLLVAHTVPSAITVLHIGGDGALGEPVKQAAPLDAGIYAHQILADTTGRGVIMVTRGNVPAGGKPEDPGALKVYGYNNGALVNKQSVAPGGGYGFQPRHIDFHPRQPWVYLSVEAQNLMQMYRQGKDGRLTDAPVFSLSSLEKAGAGGKGQAASTVHVDAAGKFVYQGNRSSDGTGENSIAVYAVDQKTGEPRRIQNIGTRGVGPRTFSLDPSGRMLVAANQVPGVDAGVNTPASLAVFRIAADGKLTFVRKYDLPEATGSRSLFWAGFLALP